MPKQLVNSYLRNIAMTFFFVVLSILGVNAQDTTPPVINSLSPANGATNISVHLFQINFQITFDEFVSMNTGKVRIRRYSDDVLIATTNALSSPISSDQKSFKFGESYGLETNTKYYMEVDDNIFRDTQGNFFEGINDKNTWTFTTEQTAPNFPSLSYMGSFDGPPRPEDVVTNEHTFGLIFSRVIRGKSGRALLFEGATDKVVAVSTIKQGSGYSTDGLLDFDRIVLKPSTSYYIQIDAGYYEDVFGNEYAGINDKTTWAFTTKNTDGSNPMISSLNPAHLSTGQEITSLGGSFSITFDEKVSHVSGKARLVKTSNGEVVSTSPFEFNNEKSTFHGFSFANKLLETNTSYHIEIDAGSFVDVFGNAFPGITNNSIWSFSTPAPDTNKPTVSSLTPSNNSTNASLATYRFTIDFDEAVKFNVGSARLVKTSDGSEVPGLSINTNDNYASQSFSIGTTLLQPATQYHIEMDAGLFVDLFGNESEEINDQTWSFTTQGPESDAPAINVLAPNTSSIIDVTSNFFIIYNESVKVNGGGEVRLVETGSGQIMAKETTVPGGSYFGSFRFFDFDDRTTLQADTKYHIEMDVGFFEDVFGNLSEAITGNDTWSFTTKKEVLSSPRITSLSPSNNATDISVSQKSFSITLDVDVSKTGNGQVKLVKTNTNETVKSVPLNLKYDKEIVIDFGITSLDYGTEYHIELDNNSLCKVDGTTLPGFSGKSTWSFTTVPKLNQEMTFSTLNAKKYGEAAFDLEASADTGLPITFASSNEEIATIVDGTLTIIGAGSVEITASQAGNEIYASVSKSQTLTVSKAALTATFNSTTSTFGQALPTLSFSYSGFVNGDNESVLDEKPSVSTNLSNLNAGNYDVQVSGGKDDNYEISLTSGQLTVGKADATISLSGLEQIEDGNDKTPVVTTSPVGLNYLITFNGASEPPNTIGEYTIEVIIDELNYKGSQSASMKVSNANEVLSIESDLSVIKPLVYPNPVDDYLFLGSVRSGKVQIHDLSGKSVFNQAIDQAQAIDLKDIETGIYYLVLIDQKNNEYYRTKIFKK